jgi:hypothetical protein
LSALPIATLPKDSPADGGNLPRSLTNDGGYLGPGDYHYHRWRGVDCLPVAGAPAHGILVFERRRDGMNKIVLAAAFAAGTLAVTAAGAEPYVDYTPMKGVWEVQTIKVDPNKVDDYLTELKKNFIPVLETLKRHGVIDQYLILQKLNSGAGANVQIVQHFPSAGMLDPDQARDQAIEKEIRERVSKEQSDKIVDGLDKYRTFDSDELWTQVEMSK